MVTSPIPSDFVLPIFAVSVRHSAVPGATVPETAVHKNRQPFTSEYKIWFAEKWLIPTPSADSVDAKD